MKTLSRICLAAWLAFGLSAAAGALEIGDAAPSIKLDKWLVGQAVDPAAKDGNVYLVEFWQIPSQPCEEATRKLNKLHAEYKDRGVKVMAINAQSEEVTRQRFAANANEYPSALDEAGAVIKPWLLDDGRNGLPFAFIVDKAGLVVWMGNPLNPEMEATLKGVLDGTFDVAKAKEIAKITEELTAALQLQDPAAVLEHLQKLAELDAANARWTISLYQFASQSGNAEVAAAALENWKKNFPDDPAAQIQLAIALVSNPDLAQRDPAAARAAARHAATLDPAGAMVNLTAAQIMMEIACLDEAEEIFARLQKSETLEAEAKPVIESHLEYIAKLKALQAKQ